MSAEPKTSLEGSMMRGMNLGRNVFVPMGLLITMGGGVFGFGKSSARAEETERRVFLLEDRVGAADRERASLRESHGNRIVALEIHYAHISNLLGRIDDKLDRTDVLVKARP